MVKFSYLLKNQKIYHTIFNKKVYNKKQLVYNNERLEIIAKEKTENILLLENDIETRYISVRKLKII